MVEGRPATAVVRNKTTELTIGDVMHERAHNLRDFDFNQEYWKTEKGRLNKEEKEQQKAEREKQRALEEEYVRQQNKLFLQKTAGKVKDVQEALKREAAGLISALRQIDVNGDGDISQREFCGAVSQLQGISVSQAEVAALYRHFLNSRPIGQGQSSKHLTIENLVQLLDGNVDAEENDVSLSAGKTTHHVKDDADATQQNDMGTTETQPSVGADACGSGVGDDSGNKSAAPAPKPSAAITSVRRGWEWRMQLREKHLARTQNKDYVTADEKVAAQSLREKTAEQIEEDKHLLRALYNEHLSLPAHERNRLLAKGLPPYSENRPFPDGFLCNLDSAHAEMEVLTCICTEINLHVYEHVQTRTVLIRVCVYE